VNKNYLVKSSVISKTCVDGIHQWKDAPHKYEYLRYPHRHLFYIEARTEVNHTDRDIEFIDFARNIKAYLLANYWSETDKCCLFGNMSCEMIARELVDEFFLDECTVYEDNENGGTARRFEVFSS